MDSEKTGNRPGVFEAAPLFMAALLIAWRFLHLGLAPFIRDEPILQIILGHEMAQGHMPMLGLMGSYGLRYGTTAMWFYMPIRLFTASATCIMAWHALSFVAAFAFFFASARRAVGKRGAAWGTLLAASSPLLFFYSRLAWDNTLSALLSALLLHELIRLHARPTRSRFLAVGFLCGLALDLHPMAVPLVAAALFCAWPATKGARAKNGAWLALPIAALLALWAIGLEFFWVKWPGNMQLSVRAPAGHAFGVLWGALAGLMHFFTPASLFPFFEASSFASLLPLPLAWLYSTPGMVLSSMAGWGCVAFLVVQRPYSVATRFALSVLAFTALFLMIVRPAPLPPHYFTPCWWIGFYALAAVIERAQRGARAALQCFVLTLVLANTIFLSSMLKFVARNEGTRLLRYGTSLREIERVTAELCRSMTEAGAVVHLENVPGVVAPSIAYFGTYLPECGAHTIFFWPEVSPVMSSLHYELRYGNASPDDSSLELRRIPEPK